MPEIKLKAKPDSEEDIIKVLNPIVKEWFFSKFKSLSLPQLYAVLDIHKRKNVLVSAPTGSGKTLTAFLSILNELINLSEAGNLKDQIYAVYISPLKALNNDIEINLMRPLEEMKIIAKEKFNKDIKIRVDVRTGDTTSYEKSKMLKNPPHILITTPESLAIVLSSSKFKEKLNEVWWCVIDEVHALAENKRGTHLSLSLERLNKICNFTRIGLSATVAPLDEIAKYLVGDKRDCEIIDIQFMKNSDIKVLSPVKNIIKASYEERERELYKLLNELIHEHKTTLVFTNTRAATERVVHNLKERFPSEYKKNIGSEDSLDLIGAHHGSLSKKHRLKIEQQLREGKLKAVVCSTSLELGIDIGFIDLVILLGSPKSVARALQRIGRAGHKLHDTSKGRIVVLDRDDLVECSLILKSAIEKKIDRIHIPENALDVLAQQIFGIAIEGAVEVEEVWKLVTKSYCYRNLVRSDFDAVISYLAGEYSSLSDSRVYAKIWHKEGKIGKRSPIARMLYMTNIGTIPDQTGVKVMIGDEMIGVFDEGFLESLSPGDIFVLGGNTYEFRFSRGTVAQVKAAVGKLPTVPSWISEMLPLSFDLANSIQRFRKYMLEKFDKKENKLETKESIIKFINEYLYVDSYAANSIYEYFREQYLYSFIPNENLMIIEHYKDEGKVIHCFHSLYGRRVNDVLSRAIAFAIMRQQKRDVRVSISDNGFTITCDKTVSPVRGFKLLKSSDLRKVMEIALDKSQILVRRFRHCASRALMILRNYKGFTKSVGRQQVSSMILMSAVRRISKDFPVLKEAKREVLEDKMDIESAVKVLKDVEDGKIKIKEIETNVPSPFAFNLALQGYTDILRMEEKIDFVRRMHEMVLAKIALKRGMGKSDYVSEQLGRSIDEGSMINNESDENNKEKRKENFSYESIWKKEDEEEYERKLEENEEKKILLFQLKKAAHRVSLDAKTEYECERLINGEREGFKKDFKEWLNNLLTGAVPKAWGDEIVKFLERAGKEI